MSHEAPKVRQDLVYRSDPRDLRYYYVKDPIALQFYRFNAVQTATLQRLDGKSTLAEIVDAVSEELEIEIEIENAEKLIERFRELKLLTVSAYRMEDRASRAALKKRLRPAIAAARQAEPLELEPILNELERGDPCAAAGMLERRLEQGAEETTARALLESIHRAFFLSHRAAPPNLQMFHLWNPERFLTWVDRRFGAILFGPIGASMLAALLLITAAALPDVRLDDAAEIRWYELALAVALYLAGSLIHELSHGLACRHFGGSPSDMGFLLMYGVIPGFYCDTSDSYLFETRRQKLLVHFAGIAVSFAWLSVWILAYVAVADTFPLRRGMAAVFVFFAVNQAYNVMPFIKLDGYYALSDALGIRNLRERSFEYCRELLAAELLGLRDRLPDVSPRERRIFLWFGVSASVYTVVLVYGLYISFLLPLAIQFLGPIGVVITVLYALSLIRRSLIDPGLALARLLRKHSKVVFTPARTALFSSVAVLTIGLLSLRWSFEVDGTSVVEPGQRALVIAQEPGQLVEISVREGQRVKRGQIIGRLEDLDRTTELAVRLATLRSAEARLALLNQGTRPQELAAAAFELRSAKRSAAHAHRLAALSDLLAEREVLTESSRMIARSQYADRDAHRDDAALKLALIRSGPRSEDILALEAEVARLEADLEETRHRLERMILRSPIDGVVATRDIEEQTDRHYPAGATIFEIHDLSRVRIEISLEPSEMFAAVNEGQPVAIRMHADPHETVTAVIQSVRPTAGGGRVIASVGTVDTSGWRTGMSGRARIYGEPRSVAYRVFAVPLLRLLAFDAWRLFG